MLPLSAKIVPPLTEELCLPFSPEASTQQAQPPVTPVCWRVHLLAREPKRLPILLLVTGMGAVCVWLIFGTLLPVFASALLLTGSVSEYLFPVTYRLTEEAIYQEALTSRIQLPWKDVRRCQIGHKALLLTSLAEPSRLDAFRGVLLRFAPEGQPGDKSSLRAMIARCAPHVLPENTLLMAEKEPANTCAIPTATPETLCVENSQT